MNRICPLCGRPKSPNAKRCQVCYGLSQRRISERDIEIYNLVKKTGNMSEVARMIGLSRQRVHVIYHKVRKVKIHQEGA